MNETRANERNVENKIRDKMCDERRAITVEVGATEKEKYGNGTVAIVSLEFA